MQVLLKSWKRNKLLNTLFTESFTTKPTFTLSILAMLQEAGVKRAGEKLYAYLKKGHLNSSLLGLLRKAPWTICSNWEKPFPISSPQVFLDGGDLSEIGADVPEIFNKVNGQKPYDIVFKRELPKKDEARKHIYPLPFCAQIELLQPSKENERTRTWHFSLRPSSSLRKELGQRIKESGTPFHGDGLTPKKVLWSIWATASHSFCKTLNLPYTPAYLNILNKRYQITGQDYIDTLYRSQIAVSVGGRGFDTLRYWEIPACGAMLISQKPTIQIHNNFEEGKNAVFFESVDEFFEKPNYYSTHEYKQKSIAEAGRKHLLSHHTTKHRANYLLQVVEKHIGLRFKTKSLEM